MLLLYNSCMRRSSKKLPLDPNQRAAEIVRISTEDAALNPFAFDIVPIRDYLAAIGRKGGLKGGKARAARLSQKRRSAIASKAAKARWKKSH
jgi:hypothetical protein